MSLRVLMRMSGWVVLAAAVCAAAVVLYLAHETTRSRAKIVGHASATFIETEERVDDSLVAVGRSILIAGAAGAVVVHVLVGLRSRGSRAGLAALGAVAALTILAGTVAADVLSEGESFEGLGREYGDVEEIANAMAVRALGCQSFQIINVTEPEYWTEAAECAVENKAALDDGFDHVLLYVWADDDALEAWQEATDARVKAVVGSTWLSVCEFQSTCAQIQAALGGRSF